MNPFKFYGEDWSPYENRPRVQWIPRQQIRMKWPADYRSGVCWVFALTILTSLWNIARAILHPHSRTLLQNLLVGPTFYSAVAAMSAIALWAIWKNKPWAKRWAVAASSVYSLEFLRQFIIPVRPAWDHYVSSLVVAVIGVVAFSWRVRELDSSRSD
jgi:hypothetical protein